MQSKLKHFLCLTIIGIFLYMGFASDFLDESTNASVNLRPDQCETRPPFTGTLTVTVSVGGPESGLGWLIEAFMTDQKINDTINCTGFYQHYITNQGIASGFSAFVVQSPSFTHDNKGDLWRVEVRAKLLGTEDWSFKKTKVIFYDETTLSFTLSELTPL